MPSVSGDVRRSDSQASSAPLEYASCTSAEVKDVPERKGCLDALRGNIMGRGGGGGGVQALSVAVQSRSRNSTSGLPVESAMTPISSGAARLSRGTFVSAITFVERGPQTE